MKNIRKLNFSTLNQRDSQSRVVGLAGTRYGDDPDRKPHRLQDEQHAYRSDQTICVSLVECTSNSQERNILARVVFNV